MSKRIKTIIGLFDAHLRDREPHPSFRLAVKFIAAIEPDEVVLGGDYLDCGSISHWKENKRLELEGARYKQEIKTANYWLDYIQRYTGKVTYLIGNHEDWIEQYVQKNPQMQGFVDLDENLCLTKRGIDVYPLNTLYKTGALHWTHGMFTTMHHAKKHYDRLGCSVIYGHVHTHQVWSCNQQMQEPFVSMSIGGLCGDDFSYLKNKYPNWINQFVKVYVDTKTGNFNIIPITIIDNSFIWNGRIFK